MQKGRRACLPASKGRVGGAGAVNRLQRRVGGANLGWDIHMGDEVFAARAVAVGVIGQAGVSPISRLT